MGQKIVVGPFNRGLKNDVTAFNIDNEAFPFLLNAYQWRGRVKRKRGTSLLGRLRRWIGTTSGMGNLVVTILPIPIPVGISSFTVGVDVFVDPGGASPVNLITNSAGTGVLNRATGVLTITGSQPNTAVVFIPTLPVMGLEDFLPPQPDFPGTIGFDTRYAYNISPFIPFPITDVSYYRNPAANPATMPNYVPKATWTPLWWNGQDYQQFWTRNYQGSMWTTNGINVPFSPTNIGMQFKHIVTVTIVAGGPPAQATLNIVAHGLVVGDFVFVNEVVTTTGINFQTGYVITVTNANNVIVEFPNATIATNGTGGIAQYLTSRSDTTKDTLRWYDGDPTNGLVPPTFVQGKGWVNFMPPLSREAFDVGDLVPAQYYLVGARVIFEFKDRLLFFGPVVQDSTNDPIYLQDAVIFSQNGTAYYTASFTGDPSLATTIFHPILVPINQTAAPNAYWEDQTGFGDYLLAGTDQPITTVAPNRDVLLVGFLTLETRLVYSGSDLIPFNFYIINSELGSFSTFSAIPLDEGTITRGNRGIIITGQTQSSRIDLDISDEVFQMKLIDNGSERVTAQRDFINEWIYLTYPVNNITYKFPTQTLQYNYRDQSWGVFNECYTTYGQFRQRTGYTWATIGMKFPTWASWNEPWNAGSSTLLQPIVIAGNQQGFVLFRNSGTDEDVSVPIQNFTAGSTVVSPNHCLNEGDYIVISGALGTIGAQVNDKIFSVSAPVTTNTFTLNPVIVAPGTYLGGGLITRMYVPFIQTKQFPVAWNLGRKTRLGPQQYLLSTTSNAQIQLLIFLSQDSDFAYNDGPINPANNVINDTLVYSTVLYTCPESTNLGLTPANINLQMVSATSQQQIWHRINTSLIGDTVQLGFTMSDVQMRDADFKNQFSEIELHGFILDVNPSQMLS